jgi:F0F1-type ATP synthase epsilon subunit
MTDPLRLIIRTPSEVVLDTRVQGARVPTPSGQAGLRPRQEPLLLVVEPGLIVYHLDGEPRFAASAGGLFQADRDRAVLYTPFAVLGERAEDVIEALDRAFAVPDSELAARRRLGELEDRIVKELRHRSPMVHGRKTRD